MSPRPEPSMARHLPPTVLSPRGGSPPAAAGDDRTRADDARADDARAEAAGPSGPAPDGALFVEAMDAIVGVREVDPVARARLDGMGDGPDDAEGAGPGLARALFRLVMPRLHDPEVLRADNHRTLLEAIEATLLRADRGDALARRGIRVIQQDLWRLAALRMRRNGLIDG